ncbi:hypothetical protein K9L63_01070 [Candidatus Gracilibacteria bacterium]|nr:hypothetical protein [Candidatus Gracilibacteria bacterium]
MKKILFSLGVIFISSASFAATLEISQVAHSGIVPKNGVRIPFTTITATARGGNVSLSDISVQRNGLSEDNDVSRLIAITNDFKRSLDAGLIDGVATLRFRNPLIIDEGTSAKITVYGNIDIEFPTGRTLFFTLKDITSNAEDIVPIASSTHPQRNSVVSTRKTRDKPWFRIVCKDQVCRKIPREGNFVYPH